MQLRTGTLAGLAAMALGWAFVWALPGGVIEAIDNIAPGAHGFTRQIDMWPQTLGLPGLAAGVVFSLLLPITEGRRRFAELSPLPSGAWGAASGLLVGGLVVWVMDTGLSEPWQLAAVVVGYAALMGAVSGILAAFLGRYALPRLGSAAS